MPKKTKTIIMLNPVMEARGSLFPLVNITHEEATAKAKALKARLPTSGEYDRLFAARPWPFGIFEWTSTNDGESYVVRGGSWYFRSGFARASYRGRDDPGARNDLIGFRCARDVPMNARVPRGWIEI